MEIANADIRNEAKAKKVMLWQIAAKYGLNDGNFSRLLRVELSNDKKEKIRAIISMLASGEG